jgi:clathrin heavy chain
LLSYNVLRPDVVQELSWVHGLNDFSYPYQLQAARDQQTALVKLREEIAALKSAKPKTVEEDSGPILNPAFGNTLMIGGPAPPPPMMNGGGLNPQATGWGGVF